MQRTYKVVEKNAAGEETGVYVDAIKSRDEYGSPRVFLEHGQEFTAQLDTEKIWDRRGKEPVQVDTGREYVTGADIDVLPGDLTALIRTGRAVDVSRIVAAVLPKKKAGAKKLRK